jgi:ribokinase
MSMFDVVTFGSATLDVFVSYNKIGVFSRNKRKGIFLPLGEKIEGEEISFFSGGGGANTAGVFTNLGFKTGFCGMVGSDFAGKIVMKELKNFKINDKFILKTDKKPTSCSIVFSGEKGRVVLPYRGASGFLGISDIPFRQINAKWFYLAPLSGKLAEDFLKIIDIAKRNNIKTALNPSKYQLKTKEIEKALKKTDILILNQEEAGLLTKIPFEKEKQVFRKLDKLTEGICIMTKGKKGVAVSDGKFLYTASILNTPVIDRTGAGDSFGAGFVAQYMKTNDIISSIQFATANSAANLKKIGAKEGILRKGQRYKKVKVTKQKL